jgi:hypothetical protein
MLPLAAPLALEEPGLVLEEEPAGVLGVLPELDAVAGPLNVPVISTWCPTWVARSDPPWSA